MKRALRSGQEEGIALITAVVLLLVLFILGTGLIILGNTEFHISKSFSSNSRALYVADGAIQEIVAKQNDATLSPRYLFNSGTYQTTGANPYLVDFTLTDPGSGKVMGTCTRQIVNGKDPMVDPPPYKIRATSTSVDSTRIVEAELSPMTLLQYAIFGETDISLAANITLNGKIYTASTLHLLGPNIVFNRDVEYVAGISNPSNGTFNAETINLADPWPSLTSLVDLTFFEDASKNSGICDGGYGLYIGPDSGERNNALFTRSAGVYEIDLTLFDFSGYYEQPREPITYNGTNLIIYNTSDPITRFNGVIFVEGELHIWGINGGRSIEDYSTKDKTKPLGSEFWYPGPNGAGENDYSNNRLDSGEDGDNAGQINGILDPAGLGINLTVVTSLDSDIYVEHNIFMAEDAMGRNVNLALVSGDAIYITEDSPKTIVIEAALLARGADAGTSWNPLGTDSTHQDNYWAKTKAANYVFDLDYDGTLEADNGQGQPSDRNENSMMSAWSLISHGSLVTADSPVSGIWASGGHIRVYDYNDTLVTDKPPCYPVVPIYDVIPGSWYELQ